MPSGDAKKLGVGAHQKRRAQKLTHPAQDVARFSPAALQTTPQRLCSASQTAQRGAMTRPQAQQKRAASNEINGACRDNCLSPGLPCFRALGKSTGRLRIGPKFLAVEAGEA
ncbi:uncharacterized protein VTP21DRAFT_2983 [Calcarisporiella thermophila]|uniref:uncharacterized protein n=1 Tax=Calcarisporiella thermophila TaxID=911321 RepID=UPI0037427A29